MNNNYDVIVLGGGISGSAAAVRASQLGASVLLIDKGTLGGTCLHRGCIPTKFLWETLHLEEKAKKLAEFGFNAESAKADFQLVQQRKKRAIDFLAKGIKQLLASYSITYIEGPASFSGNRELTVATPQENMRVTGKKIIIAAGSMPKNIPGFAIDHNKILDSTDVLNLEKAPKSLLVIGGGAIGIELAAAFAGFGTEVVLTEKEFQLLPGESAGLANEVKKMLQRKGIKVHTGVNSANKYAEDADKILIATGRQPDIESLNLNAAGVRFSPKGIEVNEYLETSAEGIYAAGDITGNNYIAYIAQAQGISAAENAFGEKKVYTCSAVPRVVFCTPPVAAVGAREHELPEGAKTGVFPFTASGRAFIENERAGAVKIFTDRSSVIVGGHIIGPHAEDLITIIALAVRYKLKTHDLCRDMFFHPSIAEAIYGACEDAEKKCVELPKKAL